MKRCDNCFENNSDGATNCVICGEPLPVPQLGAGDDSGVANAASESSVYDPETGASKPWGAPQDSSYSSDEIDAAEAFEGSDIAIAIQEYAAENGEVDLSDSKVVGEDPEGPMADAGDDSPVEEETPTVLLMDDDWADDESDSSNVDVVEETVATANSESSVVDTALAEVATGTVVLQVFHDDEPRVVQSIPIVHDITLIGREDPHRDVFPDIDIGNLEKDGVSARHVSRQHLRLLRDGNRFHLFVYKGTTGTQVNKELVDPSQYGKRFEIAVGDRIILGGKVRMKLTTQQ